MVCTRIFGSPPGCSKLETSFRAGRKTRWRAATTSRKTSARRKPNGIRMELPGEFAETEACCLHWKIFTFGILPSKEKKFFQKNRSSNTLRHTCRKVKRAFRITVMGGRFPKHRAIHASHLITAAIIFFMRTFVDTSTKM